jgi:type III restriction enzyme
MTKILKFKFEASQPHQMEAIESVIGIFKGFSQDIAGFQLEYDVVPNIQNFFDFDEEWLYGNYQEVVNTNNGLKLAAGLQPDLPMNTSLIYEDGLMLSGIDNSVVRFPVFTIEMETGTGKTYTYFRTIHELKQQFGFRKFIVVVPSVAIYEGTIKAFKQTKEHFKTLYGNENIHLTEYDGQQISRVRSFATSSFTEIMVMTIDSFNKSSNIIYKPTEKLQGEWLPFQYIQATRPILILDESQNYRSSLSREALRTLNPLFAVNYSATPVDKYNLLYRLSPVDAFRHNLVKKIKVLGVTQQHNLNDSNLSLSIENINNERGLPTATIKAYVQSGGTKSQQAVKIKKGDDLFAKTHNPDFTGFVVEEINARTNQIIFTNQSILSFGGTDSITLSKREIFRVQIEETIKFHFERQRALREKGIKVLSLFFIDRVANYKGDEPFIKTVFESAFNKMKVNDDYFKNIDAGDVHKGYFAQKKGESSFLDTLETTGTTSTEKKKIQEAEKEAFHLIMQDKERLLSFSEKTAFIFAHSALREGWDNPNVFCICTLNTAQSENRKRQEIGRGLRLARNEEGEQVKEEGVNILTVVANESYEAYVNSLQSEYAETGDVAPPSPTKAKRDKAKRNDQIFNSLDFRTFWKALSIQTTYTINIDTPELISQCSNKLNSDGTVFPESQIVITRGEFVISDYTFILVETKMDLAKIKLSITDINGRNDVFEQWYPVGYDFGRKSRDINLAGYKVIQIDQHSTAPIAYFGNGVMLHKGQPHSFSGNPDLVQHQRTVQQVQETYPVFNLIGRASKAIGLTRPTIVEIFKKISENKKVKIFTNPEGFASVFIKTISEQLANHIAERIEYSLFNSMKELELYLEPSIVGEANIAAEPQVFYGKNNLEANFPPEKEFTQRELIPGSKSSLYDQIQTDSDVERRFVQNRLQEDDSKGDLVCYFKFPANFKIKIPKIIGNYNPDWGIIRFSADGKSKLQLVRETKGSMNPNLLQFSNEKRKIDCAKKHFRTIGINYRQVTDTIPNYWESELSI